MAIKLKALTNKSGEARTLTATDARRARRIRDADPALVAAYKNSKLRYPGKHDLQKTPGKIRGHLWMDKKVVAAFKSKGPDWKTRINNLLVAFVEALG